MPRKPKVQRTPEEKWQIVLEGLKSGNVAETCRKYEIAPTLYYRWKDEVEEGAKAALGGRAQPRAPMWSRTNGSSNWSGRWADRICRSMGFTTNLNQSQLSFGAPMATSSYIANVGDGTNWLERLTASLKEFKTNVKVDEGFTTTSLATAAYTVGATYTTGNIQCLSGSSTVSDCAVSSVKFIGVAQAANGSSATVARVGSAMVNYDTAVSPSAGWWACSSATVAGKVTAQLAACATGRTVGIVENSGTGVTSGSIALVHF